MSVSNTPPPTIFFFNNHEVIKQRIIDEIISETTNISSYLIEGEERNDTHLICAAHSIINTMYTTLNGERALLNSMRYIELDGKILNVSHRILQEIADIFQKNGLAITEQYEEMDEIHPEAIPVMVTVKIKHTVNFN